MIRREFSEKARISLEICSLRPEDEKLKDVKKKEGGFLEGPKATEDTERVLFRNVTFLRATCSLISLRGSSLCFPVLTIPPARIHHFSFCRIFGRER